MENNFLTKESFEKLEAELNYLKNVKRKEIIRKIKEAKEFGDLSENAAYKEAREEEAFNESKILRLEKLLKTAKISDSSNSPSERKISIGAKVILEKNGELLEYTIVDQNQADFATNKISLNSPLARSLNGKKPGEIISIKIPKGEIRYKIIAIK